MTELTLSTIQLHNFMFWFFVMLGFAGFMIPPMRKMSQQKKNPNVAHNVVRLVLAAGCCQTAALAFAIKSIEFFFTIQYYDLPWLLC
jgi:hypothetical protein